MNCREGVVRQTGQDLWSLESGRPTTFIAGLYINMSSLRWIAGRAKAPGAGFVRTKLIVDWCITGSHHAPPDLSEHSGHFRYT